MDGLGLGAAAAFSERSDWSTGNDMMDGVDLEARLGKLFEPPRDDAKHAPIADSANRRGAERLPVDLDAKLRELGSMGSKVRVLNLSDTGFMAATDADLAVGARVWLMLPGRERANAVVRWIESGRIGAEFAEPIAVEGLTG